MKKRLVFVTVIVAVLIFGVVAYAFAQSDSKTVTINAQVNPKFALTVTPGGGSPDIDWTGANVGSTYTQAVDITVDSNRTGVLTASWVAPAPTAAWHITNSFTTANFVKAPASDPANRFTDTLQFKPDYDTPSDTATVTFQRTYSAVQN